MKVNSKNEIEKLSKKLSVKENEAEKLNKKIQTQKKLINIFFPLIIVAMSYMFYKKLSNANQLLEMKTQEMNKIVKESYMVSLLVGAREGSSEILYSADEEKANQIISVAKEALAENIASCYKTNPEFDVYRTCFRDLSIYFHNKLEKRFGPQWIVATGRVAYCFMVTNIEAEKEEYFFKIGDIYFEAFKYKDDVKAQHNVEETFLNHMKEENLANASNLEKI